MDDIVAEIEKLTAEIDKTIAETANLKNGRINPFVKEPCVFKCRIGGH